MGNLYRVNTSCNNSMHSRSRIAAITTIAPRAIVVMIAIPFNSSNDSYYI